MTSNYFWLSSISPAGSTCLVLCQHVLLTFSWKGDIIVFKGWLGCHIVSIKPLISQETIIPVIILRCPSIRKRGKLSPASLIETLNYWRLLAKQLLEKAWNSSGVSSLKDPRGLIERYILLLSTLCLQLKFGSLRGKAMQGTAGPRLYSITPLDVALDIFTLMRWNNKSSGIKPMSGCLFVYLEYCKWSWTNFQII